MYVHNLDISIDSTDYNDDKPDNIIYPHGNILYPETGAIAVSTKNEDNIDDNNDTYNNNNDDEKILHILR